MPISVSTATHRGYSGIVQSIDFPSRVFCIPGEGTLTLGTRTGDGRIWWDKDSRIAEVHVSVKSVPTQRSRGFEVTITDRSKKGTWVGSTKLIPGVSTTLRNDSVVSLGGPIGQGLEFLVELAAPIDHILYRYSMRDLLGRGAFGHVRRAVARHSGLAVAIKSVRLAAFEPDDVNLFRREVSVMLTARHPHIMELIESYEDDECFHLVMGLAMFGDLNGQILANWGMLPDRARSVMRDVCAAVSYLHRELRVVHRDIKPENVLVVLEEPLRVKLADFGFARSIESGSFADTFCGTPEFMAPEMRAAKMAIEAATKLGKPYKVKIKHDFKVDSWSLGVMLFLMLSGRYPYSQSRETIIIDDINEIIIRWQHFPVRAGPSALNLATMLLQKEAGQRITVEDALSHKWFD